MNNLITYAQWLAQHSGNESVFNYIKATSGIDFTAKPYYSKVQQLFGLKYQYEYINDTTDDHSRFADLVKIKILENQDAFDKAYSRFTDATIDFFDDQTIHELTESGTGSKSVAGTSTDEKILSGTESGSKEIDTTDSGTKTSVVDRDSTKQNNNTKTTKKSDSPMGSTTAITNGYLTGIEEITETNNETIEDDSTTTDTISNTGESTESTSLTKEGTETATGESSATESTEQDRTITEKTYTANAIKDLRLARIGNLIKEIVETFADCFIIID